MIVLLEPERPPGFVSGGYRYQHEIGARLCERGEGELRTCSPAALAATVAALQQAQPAATVVVDGLFLAQGVAALPAGVIGLLHMAPRPGSLASLAGAIVTGEPTAAAVRTALPHVHIVRPGLDACFVPAASDAPPPPPVRVVCIGTVCPAKGQRLVADALRAARVPCELTLLGDVHTFPDHVAAVRAAAGPLPLTIAGVVPPTQVAAALQRAHLCVSASRSESFGMAVAEAVACAVPVVAFAAGEIPALLGNRGVLVPTQASDELFAHRVRDAVATLPPRPPTLATRRDWSDATGEFVAACRAIGADGGQKRTPA